MFILFPMEIRCIITTTITTHSLMKGMVPKKELIQPEEKVVLKLGNRNLEFSEEIKDKIAMTSYYNEIGKSNGEKFRKFYQNAQIAVMEDVMKKVYPFYDNLMEQANKIAFQRLLSRKIYDIREADYYGKVQNTSLKGKEPLKFYSEYRRDYLLGGRTGREKLANPVNTMMCFVEALKDHAYILKMIEARILVEHGLLKEYNFDTAKLDTRRENIKNVLGSVCNREHTDQEIQKAYEDVLNLIVLVIVQCATFPVRVNASCITNDFYHQRGIAFHIEVLCNIQPMHFPFNRLLNFKESKLLQFIQKCLLLHDQTFW